MDALKEYNLKPGMVAKFYHPAVGQVDVSNTSAAVIKKLEATGYLVKKDKPVVKADK